MVIFGRRRGGGGGGGSTPQKSRNYIFKVKFSNSMGGGGRTPAPLDPRMSTCM